MDSVKLVKMICSGCDSMARLKGRVYIPTRQLRENEQYDSFEEMVEARPDCESDVTGDPVSHYTAVPEEEYETGMV